MSSINHYYSSGVPEVDAVTDAWWSQSQTRHVMTESPPSNRDQSYLIPGAHAGGIFCVQTPPFGVNLNLKNHEDEELMEVTREELLRDTELLFEKSLTPSDVGKLNRLVIPKQHAERNFPMNCGADSCENGVLLSFLDELGKSWRFRYSYWNSSQSYVLTKGWSRFVKDKRLDAGDVVTFSRHRVSTGRLFIGWRRRNQNTAEVGVLNREISAQSYPTENPGPSIQGTESPVPQNQAITGSYGNSKRLRLFGVNLEFHGSGEDNSRPPTPPEPYNRHQYYTNHMDMISFSGGGGGGDSLTPARGRGRFSGGSTTANF